MPSFDRNRGNNSYVRTVRILVLTILLAMPLASPTAESAPAVPAFSHIFVIIMENREFGEVVNPSQAPFITKLARDYAVANPYYAVTHPSLPNYIALTGGDTFGITDDCTDCPVTGENLADQVEAHQRTWKAYMEGLPAACFLGSSSGEYAKKHNPFVYYTNIATNPARCRQVVPLSELDTDLSRGTLPDLVWITPDMCHSMHDCETRDGDRWLATIVPKVLASRAWRDGGVLFVTWDEGTSEAGCCGKPGGGKVAMLAISPLSRRGYRSNTESNHYALLRTIEDAWSLGHLRHAGDAQTPVLADLFQR